MRKIILFFSIVCGVFLGISSPLVYADSEDMNDEIPEIYIKAINPGYTIDGKSNVGEMIEIARKHTDDPISLAGATVGYTNSSGNYSILFEFPEYSWMTGETLLLRLASSPDSGLAAVNYSKTIAFKASLDLRFNNEVVDEVCWNGKEGCYKEFKSTNPTVLVRNFETGEFEHLLNYVPEYDAESYYVEEIKEEGYGEIASQCRGLQFSEILSYYETSKSEQFIELYNPSSEQIVLDGCLLKYKNKQYLLKGLVGPEEYFVYYPDGFSLTKNPTNFNTLELIDVDESIVDKLDYPNGQRKGMSYMFVGYDKNGKEIWRLTYAPTPGGANNYQEFRTCEAGKVMNEVTGNCVKVATVKEKICKEGYRLNIITGRCNKIKTVEQKTCKEGYYLNPETNRCRKIKENKGADYSLEPEKYEEESSFIALYAVIGVVGVGLIYLIYEFRHDIAKKFSSGKKKILEKFSRKKD